MSGEKQKRDRQELTFCQEKQEKKILFSEKIQKIKYGQFLRHRKRKKKLYKTEFEEQLQKEKEKKYCKTKNKVLYFLQNREKMEKKEKTGMLYSAK